MLLIASILILITSLLILSITCYLLYMGYSYMNYYNMFDRFIPKPENEGADDSFTPTNEGDYKTLDKAVPNFAKKIKLKFK